MTTDRDPQQGGSYLRDPKTGKLIPVPAPQSTDPAPPQGGAHTE